MRTLTRSDIAAALQKGLISVEDLQSVIDGFVPKKRGTKPDLLRQARIIGVLAILTNAGVGDRRAKDIIMSAGGLSSATSFEAMLERSRANWMPLPPYEPIPKKGGIHQSITMFCRHRDYFGFHYTLEIRVSDWVGVKTRRNLSYYFRQLRRK